VLVEYCNRIPAGYKVNGWTEKYILRRAMADYLPKGIINRRKRGFTVPTDQWLFKELWEYTTGVIEKGSLVGKCLDKDKVKRLMDRRGDFRVSSKIFGLLMLEEWNRLYLEEGV
jgi:asparagine synthase (glutamine-hydrolysing)